VHSITITTSNPFICLPPSAPAFTAIQPRQNPVSKDADTTAPGVLTPLPAAEAYVACGQTA
jgi:hypothetical protein